MGEDGGLMLIQNVCELPELSEMLAGGYVVRREHPTEPLAIYNYTAKAQYEPMWNETTLTCRGLIVDAAGNVVARPFRKFFNLEQVETLPDEPFEVFEKVDGSLGVTYWLHGEAWIASRGSFDSPQARMANKMLTWYDRSRMDPAHTYLFEIIYPENRIVVDYGTRRDLVLLAVIETATGREVPLSDVGFPVVERFDDVTDAASLKELTRSNTEGFVIRYAGGLRVKVKLAEYVRLHRILTGITEKRLLEDYLMAGTPVETLLERVPDEFYAWVQATVGRFRTEYAAIEAQAREQFAAVTATSRKEYAEAFCRSPLRSILFLMLDGRDYSQTIWKMLKPAVTPFIVDEV